ncbi:PspC domain-containing protein [Paenibacillus sp. sptzw28]|uniref:PspC domain-containing protein n=1 Tax=Paenibacillus sp. sptzw28 TaxID=715179 RepID=UPI001C6E381F|nr:PspC domain-containing protein [Paenibacillus sp. sptzw28]QYR21403.1 PspC domain-containing protein [Paenibacillus sp. sptzw28]
MNKLYRSRTDSKVSGLCGGIGQYLGIDSTIVRLLMIVLAVFSLGTIVLIYLVASVIVPKAPYEEFAGYDPFRFNHYN